MSSLVRLTAVLSLCLIGLSPAAAQEPVAEPLPFWETRQGLNVQAAVQMALHGDPLAAAAIRVIASEQVLLPAWHFRADTVPPLRQEWLDLIADDTFIPDLRGRARDEAPRSDWAFYDVYCQALVLSLLTPAAAFERAAEENRHVTFAHLFRNPKQFRGQVIPVQGRLMMLRKWDAPRKAQEDGVRFIYEGWVEGPTRHTNPYCVVFTELPAGLKVSEKVDRKITFNGYFIKKFRYTAANADRLTHLLIGPTVTVHDPAPPPGADKEEPYAKGILFYVICGLLGIVGLVLVMNWFFRRGDQRTHSQISQVREKHMTPFQDEAAPPLATPVEPPPHQNGITTQPPQPGPTDRDR